MPNIRVAENYLEYMKGKHAFRGQRNRRKIMILYALVKRKKLTIVEIYAVAGKGVSYNSIRASVSVMLKWGYIHHSPDGNYTIAAKGLRILYACQQLEPAKYREWISNVTKTNQSVTNTRQKVM